MKGHDKETMVIRAATTEEGCRLSSITLRVTGGPDRGCQVTVVGRPVTIGRGPTCDLVLADEAVSRAHATISFGPLGYVFEDLGSRNGSQVNEVIVEKAVLQPGNRIRLGDTVVEFCPEMVHLRHAEVTEERLHEVIGKSAAMRSIYAQVLMVAPTEATVVITGETGTGKEVLARAIHRSSARKNGPFVVFDCANVNRDLVGSELFGHRKGAFTGATDNHAGVFERAEKGTLFLDEIGELPLDQQARLLGVLQRREVLPLGGTVPKPVDVRVLAATHRDLEKMVHDGLFRQDLFFRLMVVSICLPALRDRKGDIPALAEHFLEQMAGERSLEISSGALQSLMERSWRGNVRELENCMQRAIVLTQGRVIQPEAVMAQATSRPAAPVPEVPAPAGGEGQPSLKACSKNAEREELLKVLAATGWNKARAARELGISLSTMKRRVREHKIEKP